jgi:hypothetical protein
MVNVEICGSDDRALAHVILPTKTARLVRKPEIQPCFVTARTSEDCTLVVEVDGNEVATHRLPAGITPIPLNMLVPASPRSRILSLMPLGRAAGAGAATRQAPPSEFTLCVRRGNAEGERLGTYSFQLMNATAFDEAYGEYSRDAAPRTEPAQFTTDARSLEEAKKGCWNCHEPLLGECCEKCGCCQAHDIDEEQP